MNNPAESPGRGRDECLEPPILPPLSLSPVVADVASGRPCTPYFEIRLEPEASGGQARFIFRRRYETDVLDIDYQIEFADRAMDPKHH